MLATPIERVITIWPSLFEAIYVPHSEREYEEMVNLLDQLIDIVGEDEDHPLASLMEILGVLIEKYEDEYIPEITV